MAIAVGNLVRVPIASTHAGDRSIPLLVNDIAAVAIVGLGFLSIVLTRKLRVDSVMLAAAAFATLGGLTAIAGISRFGFSGAEVAVGLAFLARWLLYFGIYVVIVNAVRGSDVLAVWTALENVAVAFALFGLVQSAFIPNFAQRYYPDSVPAVDWDVQGRRLVSSFLDPNYAGMMILMPLLVQIGMLAAGAPVKRWKVLVLMGGLLATLSRSSILGFVLALGIIMVQRGLSKRLLSLFVTVGIALLAAAPALLRFAAGYNKTTLSDPSALGRIVNWIRLWNVFVEHPIVGIGFNTWGALARRRGWATVASTSLGTEGGLLFVMALTGLVGLTIFLAMFGTIAWRGRRVWRDTTRAPLERGLALAIPAMIPAILFHSLFTNSLFLPLLMEPMWVLFGLGFVVANDPLQYGK